MRPYLGKRVVILNKSRYSRTASEGPCTLHKVCESQAQALKTLREHQSLTIAVQCLDCLECRIDIRNGQAVHREKQQGQSYVQPSGSKAGQLKHLRAWATENTIF